MESLGTVAEEAVCGPVFRVCFWKVPIGSQMEGWREAGEASRYIR